METTNTFTSRISHLIIIFVWSRKQFESNLSERLVEIYNIGFRPNNQLSLYYYIGSLWPISKLATTFSNLYFGSLCEKKKLFLLLFLHCRRSLWEKNLKLKRLSVLSALSRTSFIGYLLVHKNIKIGWHYYRPRDHTQKRYIKSSCYFLTITEMKESNSTLSYFV